MLSDKKRILQLESQLEQAHKELDAAKLRIGALAAASEKSYTVYLQEFLDRRCIETPCDKCSGMGVRAYPTTATWRGGIGGMTITSSVCDSCWGSGDKDRPWPSWRRL